MNPPRLFISYSWSNPQHEQWVLDLASELVSSGIDVVLDKWDLREGHDAIAFMEKMVTDPSISKVALVCDEVYVTKADGRAGGVGTETQIISAEVYAKQNQDKFVAVIAEKGTDGKLFLPTYYKSRIYIDLSESERYAESFEKLVRWVFDKPLFKKPELGKPPSFITDSTAPVLGTTPLAKRVVDGLRGDKAYARGAVDEYLNIFSQQLERFRLVAVEGEFDDRVAKSIEDFLPARNEFLQVLTTLTQYADIDSYSSRLHRFYESLIPYFYRPSHINQWNDLDFDNFKFIVHELFLYSIALLLKGEYFGATDYLLGQPYYVPGNSNHGENAAVSFIAIQEYVKSLEIRNQRLKKNRASLRADLLEQRSHTSGLAFRHLMQADLVCFLRGDMMGVDTWHRWWPDTLIYAQRQHGPFEIFARASSKSYLPSVLKVVGASSVAALKAKLESYAHDSSFPRWSYHSFSPASLTGIEQIGTRP
ncbi:TIR domain-containing protein [Acidovorax sp. ACV02]|nr:TIR domain-containing protein [Acidovorax sp. ACV02]